jgi:perosamine synthetase
MDVKSILVRKGTTLRETIKTIDSGGLGVALVVDASNKLIGIITDGDVRRSILKGCSIDAKVEAVMNKNPVVAKAGISTTDLLNLMSERIKHIPIINEEGMVKDLASFTQFWRIPVAEPLVGEKELEYVTDCIKTNWISSAGKYVVRFEEMFSSFCGSRYGVATSNGTTALHLALTILGIGKGDEVIVPTLTFVATANAVKYCNADVVFVDSEPRTWNMDPEKIEEKITSRTKAIIPVHLYGHPVDMDPILDIAEDHDLYVIEDAAEAHGAEYKGKKVGSLGDIGTFSFYGNKLITTGEGGMLVSDNEELIEKARIYRDHGMSPERRYWHPVIGYNYRLTNVQAAIGVAQLEKVDRIIESKRSNARLYNSLLSDIEGITLPPEEKWAKNVYWMYSILIEKGFKCSRDELMESMKEKGIETRPFFYPVHTMPPYYVGEKYPVAESLSAKGINLPSAVNLTEGEIRHVAGVIGMANRGK